MRLAPVPGLSQSPCQPIGHGDALILWASKHHIAQFQAGYRLHPALFNQPSQSFIYLIQPTQREVLLRKAAFQQELKGQRAVVVRGSIPDAGLLGIQHRNAPEPLAIDQAVGAGGAGLGDVAGKCIGFRVDGPGRSSASAR